MAYFLSTEILCGVSVRNPFPLQARSEAGARRIAERNFRKPFGRKPVSVALLSDDGAIVDVFSGTWASDDANALFDGGE
jgi:hypothetical protein